MLFTRVVHNYNNSAASGFTRYIYVRYIWDVLFIFGFLSQEKMGLFNKTEPSAIIFAIKYFTIIGLL